MIRGLYTGACAMLARDAETQVITNNLANLDTVGFKRDTAVFKDFPAMLIHRQNDEMIPTAFGNIDPTPLVGRMGTGVEVNDVVTQHEMGPVQVTESPLDFALTGDSYAFFTVQTPNGVRYTRDGQFSTNTDGYLVNKTGALVLGENGPIKIDLNNFSLRDDGTIMHNPAYAGEGQNRWEQRAPLDRLQLASFENPSGLRKRGYSLYEVGPLSGSPQAVGEGVKVQQGYLERSNVNIVREMVDMIVANRNYEQSARVIQTHDQILQQAINQVGRV